MSLWTSGASLTPGTLDTRCRHIVPLFPQPLQHGVRLQGDQLCGDADGARLGDQPLGRESGEVLPPTSPPGRPGT
jgi:hypothetical protein